MIEVAKKVREEFGRREKRLRRVREVRCSQRHWGGAGVERVVRRRPGTSS